MTTQQDGLSFEDMPVGRMLHSARAIRMERDRMIAFAEEFDPQPAHLGEEAAAASQFGQLCASGWHTGGVTMRLVAETLVIAQGGMGLGVDTLRWHRPVLPGRHAARHASRCWRRDRHAVSRAAGWSPRGPPRSISTTSRCRNSRSIVMMPMREKPSAGQG